MGLLATGLFNSAAMVSHVSDMALNLAKKLTIYTNGNDKIAADIEANAKTVDLLTRVTVEKRKIISLKMVALWEASDVLVTLDDGTEIKETFLVSCLITFRNAQRGLIYFFLGRTSRHRIERAFCCPIGIGNWGPR